MSVDDDTASIEKVERRWFEESVKAIDLPVFFSFTAVIAEGEMLICRKSQGLKRSPCYI